MLTAIDSAGDAVTRVAADAAASASLDVRWRREDTAAWRGAVAPLSYVPVTYTPAWIEYQLAYFSGQAECHDLSMVLLHDRQPCGVWPLSLTGPPGRQTLGSHGLPVLPPLFHPWLPERSRKTVVQRCLDVLSSIAITSGSGVAQSAESFTGSTAGLSEWHVQGMQRGARASLRHEMYVDLSLPMAEIKARFRKSYRALVSVGARTWRIHELAEPGADRWAEFRDLHVRVAGRITRAADTWELQYRDICAGDAFLVYLLDQAGAMVGGGFFYQSRDEGAYSVAAYDRALFDKPLGHVVQHRVIEVMKERGLRWYKIGPRPYSSEQPAPTDKDLSIGDFKQGFASHFFPRYVLDHEFREPERH